MHRGLGTQAAGEQHQTNIRCLHMLCVLRCSGSHTPRSLLLYPTDFTLTFEKFIRHAHLACEPDNHVRQGIRRSVLYHPFT